MDLGGERLVMRLGGAHVAARVVLLIAYVLSTTCS
jgi:hypothetical protein